DGRERGGEQVVVVQTPGDRQRLVGGGDRDRVVPLLARNRRVVDQCVRNAYLVAEPLGNLPGGDQRPARFVEPAGAAELDAALRGAPDEVGGEGRGVCREDLGALLVGPRGDEPVDQVDVGGGRRGRCGLEGHRIAGVRDDDRERHGGQTADGQSCHR